MIRFFTRLVKSLVKLILALCILGVLLYLFVLPRVLPLRYTQSVEHYAAEYGLEPSLVYAVIFCESGFHSEAVSTANAKGLMQITEDTGVWVAGQIDGLDATSVDLYDPDTNIRIGCKYLQWLLEKFDGNQETALAGYNAGHGKVAQWLADEEKSLDGITLAEIPYTETRTYVKKVELVKKLYEWIYRV
ncbi:lytic transglycosylase domain-containing protein [Anaerotignum lactatifermentans]|uniref:Lytic transglycosylase domain-containing protein n=1 Tax=Anaerotignum lactatifermentans TaxID=160404 RepID=A0ABS2GDN2_9FIRM|nr:lytic transglycosylase domain-containing protein [Anaerotignum lactatifermentans]MBM6830200.1 lytic transglycosylase domain-containing protein [Anaerotignum lactatifermentans]MBM6878727.1 lytic transglycosylase domain-containing protein [Anaerotignum lactatifermentans]MBM6951791.1 lytic transglycosylase domain-containing protein [Anaerotignum lactatifermentans]